MLNHVLFAVFGYGDDVVGALNAGGEEPTFQAFQVLFNPFRMQYGNQIHDCGHDRYTTNQRYVMIGSMKQGYIAADGRGVAQGQLEKTA